MAQIKMGFFSNIFSTPEAKPPEHAVIVTLLLSDRQHGTTEDMDQIHALADELERTIIQANAGEFDGDEFGQGECRLFMYGPDADRLHEAIDPILRKSPLAKGGSALKRYGPASDKNAQEDLVSY